VCFWLQVELGALVEEEEVLQAAEEAEIDMAVFEKSIKENHIAE
jgi:hypothetical protein